MLKPNTVLTVALIFAALTPAYAADSPSGKESSGFNMQQLGLQLYSLRNQFAKNVPGTLDEVRAMGFKNIETDGTYGVAPEKFKEELSSRGLTAVSAHFPYEKFRDDVEGVARDAKALGVKY